MTRTACLMLFAVALLLRANKAQRVGQVSGMGGAGEMGGGGGQEGQEQGGGTPRTEMRRAADPLLYKDSAKHNHGKPGGSGGSSGGSSGGGGMTPPGGGSMSDSNTESVARRRFGREAPAERNQTEMNGGGRPGRPRRRRHVAEEERIKSGRGLEEGALRDVDVANSLRLLGGGGNGRGAGERRSKESHRMAAADSGGLHFENVRRKVLRMRSAIVRRSPSMVGYVGDRSKVVEQLTMPNRLVSEESVIEGSLIDRSTGFFRNLKGDRRTRAVADTSRLLPLVNVQVETRPKRATIDTSGLLPSVGLKLDDSRAERASDTSRLLPSVGLQLDDSRAERATIDTSGLLPSVELLLDKSRAERATIDTSGLLPSVELLLDKSRAERATIDTSRLLPSVGLKLDDSRAERATIDTSGLLPSFDLKIGNSQSTRSLTGKAESDLLPFVGIRADDLVAATDLFERIRMRRSRS